MEVGDGVTNISLHWTDHRDHHRQHDPDRTVGYVEKIGGRVMKPKIIKLIEENPDLPIVPMVDSEIVGDDYGYWKGEWGRCEVTEYYEGREHIHFKDFDDEEDVLNDLVGCEYSYDPQGRDIYDLSDDEWDKLYKSIPWVKGIVVYITT